MISLEWETTNFNRELKNYQMRTGRKIRDLVKTLAFQIFRWVQKDTPVQEGNARSGKGNAKGNWRIKPLGKDRWKISNNTPYIRILEYGGYPGTKGKTIPGISGWTKTYVSKKAPKGMLRRALFRGKNELRKLIR